MGISLIFIVYKLSRSNINFNVFLQPKMAQVLFFNIVLYAVCMVFSSWVYYFLLRNLIGQDLSAKYICQAYLEVNLYKYLPGNIFHFIGRNKIANTKGISILNITTITLIEITLQIIVVFLIGLTFSSRYFYEIIKIVLTENQNLSHLVFPFSIILVGVTLFFSYKFLRKKNTPVIAIIKKCLPAMITTVLFYFCLFFIYGAIFFSFLSLLEKNINLSYALPIIGIYTISWLIGFLIPGAPGGIGIREVILTGFLSHVASQETIITAAVINRIVSIVGDLLSFFSFKIIATFLNKKEKGSEL